MYHFLFFIFNGIIIFLKCVDSLQIQCFIFENDQNFKSSPKIKFLHSLILLYSKL